MNKIREALDKLDEGERGSHISERVTSPAKPRMRGGWYTVKDWDDGVIVLDGIFTAAELTIILSMHPSNQSRE